jgi:hypothetical protein
MVTPITDKDGMELCNLIAIMPTAMLKAELERRAQALRSYDELVAREVAKSRARFKASPVF